MRRVFKYDNSEILVKGLKYKENNSSNNKTISTILFKEQKGFCAYTEEYMGRGDAGDIDHFNPNLKYTGDDGYSNWFLVKSQWNKEKANKWDKYQPVLHPTAIDFEKRIVYVNGNYKAANSSDIHAKNLISLIKLNDLLLAEERKKYITRTKKQIDKSGQSAQDFFDIIIKEDIKQISYLRAIKEEFNIDIWEMIPSQT